MKITVVYNSIMEDDGPDAIDVLAQAEAVREALVQLDHRVDVFPCSLNLEHIAAQLSDTNTNLVFNLVEALGGHGRLIHMFPSLLDALRIPYTGSSAAALRLTSNKTEAKDVLRRAGLPTPDWAGPLPAKEKKLCGNIDGRVWIVKSLWEHASLGMDADALVKPGSAEDLFKMLEGRADSLGGACFAEHFIDGREFNLSLLAGKNGPEVLPPAEILFEDFDANMPRIVDYSAKWEESSFSYSHTPRSFSFDKEDGPLLEKLKKLAQQCWYLFELDGYARVDFRVDHDGNPWILEVNANPCLSPDAGFAAALSEAAYPYQAAVDRITENIPQTNV